MNKLPEDVVNQNYRFEHEMLDSKVMKQLNTYILNTYFIVSLELFGTWALRSWWNKNTMC
jgi:hypothetical protein